MKGDGNYSKLGAQIILRVEKVCAQSFIFLISGSIIRCANALEIQMQKNVVYHKELVFQGSKFFELMRFRPADGFLKK